MYDILSSRISAALLYLKKGVCIMLEHYNVNNEMQYQKLTAEEQHQRGILGRLVGIIADFKEATRNGRRYNEELWDKTFNNPIMKEKFENRCLFGELGHPVDRQEVDMEKVCICMAEPPKKGSDGKLYGVFDILNTPNGRILKTFCDYGTRIGVSSRGSGDTFEDYNGDETVDPDTYDCECWDAVLLPAVKAARPAYVTESLDTSKQTLRRALQEAVDLSTEDEKKIMIETLSNLDVNINEEFNSETMHNKLVELLNGILNNFGSKEEMHNKIVELAKSVFNDEQVTYESENLKKIVKFLNSLTDYLGTEDQFIEFVTSALDSVDQVNKDTPEKVENIEAAQEDVMAADDAGAEMLQELQEALKAQQELEQKVKSLQEKLSVCYTKEARYSSVLSKTRDELAQERIVSSKLNEELEVARTSFKEVMSTNDVQKQEILTLQEQLRVRKGQRKTLSESLKGKDAEILKLKSTIKSLHEDFAKKSSESDKERARLAEELADSKKDSQIIRSQASAKVVKAQQLTEKYKSIAKTAVDKYIKSQAMRLGVNPEDIKNKLSENYSFNDIDTVCESLQKYKLTVNSLPFSVRRDHPVKMAVKESREVIRPVSNDDRIDDEVDSTLSNFIQ